MRENQSISSSNNQPVELDTQSHLTIGGAIDNTVMQREWDDTALDLQIKQLSHKELVEFQAHLTLVTDSLRDRTIKELKLYIASVEDRYASTPLAYVICGTDKPSVGAIKVTQPRKHAEHTGRRGPVQSLKTTVLHQTKRKRLRAGRPHKIFASRWGLPSSKGDAGCRGR